MMTTHIYRNKLIVLSMMTVACLVISPARAQTYVLQQTFNDPTPTKVGPEPDLTVGATYVFEDVASGVVALVEIVSLEQGAFLERIDDHAEPTLTTPTSPAGEGRSWQ